MYKRAITKKRLAYIISFIILLAGLLNQYFKLQETKPPTTIQPSSLIATSSAQLVKVSKVIDGDTIELSDGRKVRYIGIDTPELHSQKKSVQCFAREAQNKNRELVEGKMVRLEKDISETDRYWRLLRYVFIPSEASPSGLFVNEYLVKEGYAYTSTFPPDVEFADHFRDLEREARENKKGLWSICR